jgi:hypothetical protein
MRLFCVLCAFLLVSAAAHAGGDYIFSDSTVDGSMLGVKTTDERGRYLWVTADGVTPVVVDENCLLFTNKSSVCYEDGYIVANKTSGAKRILLPKSLGHEMFVATMSNFVSLEEDQR